MLRELSGCRRRAASVYRSGGGFEDRGDVVVGTARTEGEVSRPLLSGLHDVGEARMQRPAARRRQARSDGGSQQGMGESKALSIKLEDPRRNRLAQAGIGFVADGRFHKRHGRIGERCDCVHNLERRWSQTVEALSHKLVKIGGNRQLLAWRDRDPLTLECAREFECEERVATCCLREFDQRRPRKRRVEAGAQQVADRTKREARKLNRRHSLVGHGAVEPVW